MENVSTRLLFENVFVASPESLQLKYSLAETADNMQNLTQIQIALNLAISPEHNNGKAAQVVSCLKDTPPLRIFCIKLSSK